MKSTEKQKALILAPHTFNYEQAKTAFGLIRGTDRFEIVGVIDPEKSGQDAGVIVDGNFREIPLFASSKNAFEQLPHQMLQTLRHQLNEMVIAI